MTLKNKLKIVLNVQNFFKLHEYPRCKWKTKAYPDPRQDGFLQYCRKQPENTLYQRRRALNLLC